MNKKILLQSLALGGMALWLVLSGCAGMGGGSGCGGMGGGSATSCSGSAPKCASGFTAQCKSNTNDGSMSWVCVQH